MRTRGRISVGLGAVWSLLVACDVAPALGEAEADEIDDPITLPGKADGLDGATPAELDAILALVNTAELELLDIDIALDVRAAEAIVTHRNGADAVLGTADDDPIDDIAELDAVPWVGTTAFGKLLAWVRAHAPANEPPCVLISEYIEGKTDKNKGIELYNCGDAPVELSQIAVCLVRNDDTDCTLSSNLAPGSLAPGDVHTVCRTRTGELNNPWPPLAAGCIEELGSTMIYSGDDRMVVLHDPAETGSVHEATVLDALGRIAYRPWWSPWNDIGLRRCTAERNLGLAFYDEADWFEVVGWTEYDDWGVPPTFDCDD
jgi:hypothetical protein